MTPIQLAALAHRLADGRCISDIEEGAVAQTDAQGRRWYDTRPMVDPRERSNECIEMATHALTYAHERGLISPHPVFSHLVRIVKAAA